MVCHQLVPFRPGRQILTIPTQSSYSAPSFLHLSQNPVVHRFSLPLGKQILLRKNEKLSFPQKSQVVHPAYYSLCPVKVQRFSS